jgi:hypothetical protein
MPFCMQQAMARPQQRGKGDPKVVYGIRLRFKLAEFPIVCHRLLVIYMDVLLSFVIVCQPFTWISCSTEILLAFVQWANR